MNESGIYIVRLTNDEPIPVTRDRRYIDICARVNKENIKFGKATDFERRKGDYISDLGEENVIFERLYKIKDITKAKRLVRRKLAPFQKLSPKGGRLDWLEGITCQEVKIRIAEVIEASDLEYESCCSTS